MKNKSIQIQAFEINQPIGRFFVGKIEYSDLINLCSTDMKNLVEDNKYNIYQRKLDKKRIPSLKQYVSYSKATFPNGIILNSRYDLKYENGVLEIPYNNDTFFIVDGQHRVEALKYYKNDKIKFEVCIIIFEKINLALQTELFVTVNSEQKKVNPTIKLNLQGNDDVDTPEKIVRQIAIALNSEKDSPFYERISFTDETVKKDSLKLSLAAFMKPIIGYIYNSEYSYRLKDMLYCNKNNREILFDAMDSTKNKILWGYYCASEEHIIYLMLSNYFTVIQDLFYEEWINPRSLISKTTGYNAFMMLFKDVLQKNTTDMSYDNLFDYLKPISMIKINYSMEEIGLGNAASTRLYNKFLKCLNSNTDDVIPDLFDYIEE